MTSKRVDELQQSSCHLTHRVDCRHGVEMDVADPGLVQLAALCRGPLHAEGLRVVVGLALHGLHGQLLRHVAVERARHDGELRELRQRLYAGYDGYGDTGLARALHEVEVLAVVVEELRHGILRAEVLLELQVLEIHLGVGGLLVLLGVGRHAVVEGGAGVLHGRAVGEEAGVEAVHLLYKLRGVLVAAGRGAEAAVLLRLVAAQQQQVLYAEELEVEQLVLYVLLRGSAADDVRYYGYLVLVLYGGGDGYGARTAAYAQPLELSVLQLAVHVLAMVGRDVDVQRGELLQLVDGGEQESCAVAFQRRQHLKREAALCIRRVYQLSYVHVLMLFCVVAGASCHKTGVFTPYLCEVTLCKVTESLSHYGMVVQLFAAVAQFRPLFVVEHGVAYEQTGRRKHRAVVEARQLVEGYGGVAYALEHRLEVEVLLVARHLLQPSVARDDGEARGELACVVERRVADDYRQRVRYAALLAYGVVRGALSAHGEVAPDGVGVNAQLAEVALVESQHEREVAAGGVASHVHLRRIAAILGDVLHGPGHGCRRVARVVGTLGARKQAVVGGHLRYAAAH